LIGMFVRGHLLLCYRPRMSSYPPFGKRVNLFRFNVFGTSSNPNLRDLGTAEMPADLGICQS
jgi:hypothetical protein